MSAILREAVEADAPLACDVVSRSIQQLCTEDHVGDPLTLDAWLANKTIARFRQLITAPSKSCVVALWNHQVSGFGHLRHTGDIGLLYVAPEARFRGVSAAMLTWLEDRARLMGLERVSLLSTATAKRFYADRGYTLVDRPKPGFGVTQCWPMVKTVAP